MKWTLLMGLLVLIAVSMTTAEDPKSEPESEPEPEKSADEDSKHAGSSAAGKQVKGAGNNPASAPWAFSVPAILTFVCVAKFIL